MAHPPPSGASIAVIGEALIDLAGTGGDDDPWLARPGGSPYNVAIGLARLGRRALFVGRLSSDPLGEILRTHADRSGVDLSLAVDAPEPSTIALVELAHGVADYRFGMSGTADFQWTDAELAAVPDDVAAVHFGSLASWTPPGDAAILRRIAALRDRAVVSYDPNVRPSLQPDRGAARAAVEAAVATADVVKTSADDVAYLYPDVHAEAVAERWQALGPSLVVITSGGSGVHARTSRHTVERPARPVEVVDTVGAGDAFTAGLLDALERRGVLDRAGNGDPDADTLAGALDDAALVAALTCARAGANPPRRAEVDAARGQPG
jgi:fructokinase